MPIRLTQEQAQKRGREMVDLAHAMIQSRQDWLDTVMMARQMYQGDGPFMRDFYPTTKQFHFPIMEEKVDSFYPRVSTSFWATNPVVRVRPISNTGPDEEAEDLETFGTWAVHYDIPDCYVQWEVWNRNAIVDGVSTIKTLWQEEWRRSVETRRLKNKYAPGEPLSDGTPCEEPTPKSYDDGLDEIFGLKNIRDAKRGKNPDAPGALAVYDLTIVENGRLYENVLVTFQESDRIDEWDVSIARLVLKHASPRSEVCEPDDILTDYRASNLQKAQSSMHLTWYTVPQIRLRKTRGDWNISDAEMRFIEYFASGMQETPDNDEMKKMKDEFAGENTDLGGRTLRSGMPLVLEVYTREDLQEDGYESEVIYHVIPCIQKAVSACHLEEEVPHGDRPFATLWYRPASDRYYSTGLAAQLMAINMQANTTFNQINENQAIANRPYFFYVPTALRTDVEVLQNIQPGDGVPINDPNGVIFPRWAATPLADMQLFTSVVMMGDRVGGVPPLMSGSTQMKNAPRTARGTMALISESNVRTENFIERAQKTGWKDWLKQIFAFYGHYGDDEIYYWVVGKPRVRRRISAARLRRNCDFYFEGNTVNTNPEVMRTIAQVRYGLLAPEPLYQSDLAARRELVRSVLKAYPEGIDLERATPKLPGQGGSHVPMNQDKENQLITQGIWIEPLPQDDHLSHIAEITKLRHAPIFEEFPEWVVGMLAAHYNMHAQMLQQAEQAQAQAQMQAAAGPPQAPAQQQSMRDMSSGEMGAMMNE